MSVLSLCLFGPPRIEIDGTLISVDTRKAVALIAYLATTRQRHSRDSLAALLWSENDQPHARAALRRTLSTLNKALGGFWLDIHRETIGLDFQSDLQNLQIDVQVFRSFLAERRTHGHAANEICTACEYPLTEAAALYQNDFLAGFGLRDSSAFDDWQVSQSDILRRELANALEGLTRCHSAAHQYDTALVYARRWLSLDQLHEPAHQQLMLLHTRAGQRTAALYQYRQCVQILEQELGVAPLETTTRLYQFIKENHMPPLPPPLLAPTVPREKQSTESVSSPDTLSRSLPNTLRNQARTAYPLVGRTEEWATLLATYHATKENGRVIILEGDAGIGKTRLVEELLEYVRERGANVITARCYKGETHLAYAPIVSALRTALVAQGKILHLEILPAIWLSEAMRLLPELATLYPGLPPPQPLDNPGTQMRFFEGVRQLFLTLSTTTSPALLFIDDLHWIDEASLDWLSYVLRRVHEQPLCLVLTWRGKQPARGTPLHPLFVEARRSGNATMLSLSRLSQPAVHELAQSIVTVRTPERFVDRLYAETEGIPFFLVEYLSALEKGVLKAEQIDWSLTNGIRGLLSSRLSAVDEIGWQLLNTGAVIGRAFDFDTLREASGRSEDETINALEDLIVQGLLVEGPHNTSEYKQIYDFNHEKLRSFVYEETSVARRRLLHRRIAEVFASHAHDHRESGPLAGQIAHHYRLAGNDVAAANYFKMAGEYARTLYANAEALTHLQLALALGHPDLAALHEAIGDLYTLQGEYTSALNSYETSAAFCTADALSRVEHKLGAVYMRRGAWKLAESHLEAALYASEKQNQQNQQASIYADRSLTAHHQGNMPQALELAQRAFHLAEGGGDLPALAQTHNMLGMLAHHQHDMQLAVHHLEQSLMLAEKLQDPGLRSAGLNNLAQAYRSGSEVERALSLTEAALVLCISQGDRHREAALHNNLADLLHVLGQTETAMAHLKQAVSIYAEIGVEAGTVQPEIWKLLEW